MKINFFIFQAFAFKQAKLEKSKIRKTKGLPEERSYCCSLRAFRKHRRQSGS